MKYENYELITFSPEHSLLLNSESTRTGFRHIARYFINGSVKVKVKVCYINRTWERFKYETLLHNLATKIESVTKAEPEHYKKELKQALCYINNILKE